MATLREYRADARFDLLEQLEDYDGPDLFAYDLLPEIIDGALPFYTVNVLDVAKSALWLATAAPENGEYCESAVDMILRNIWDDIDEHLRGVLDDWERLELWERPEWIENEKEAAR